MKKKELVPCICGSIDHKNHPMSEPHHTPTPFAEKYADAAREALMANGWNEESIEEVVQAVNSHEELLNALKYVFSHAKWLGDKYQIGEKEIGMINQAISKAEGK